MSKNSPIIFLDLDGVLSTVNEFFITRKEYWNNYPDAEKLGIRYPFNSECVKIFNEILLETGAEIVLSSDWRYHRNLEELDLVFKFNGVIKSPKDLTDIDPISMGNLTKNRAHEIKKYILDHHLKDYIIIDDLPVDYYFRTDRFVKTDDFEGIKELGIKEKILEILNGSRKESENKS